MPGYYTRLVVRCPVESAEVMMALISDAGFESFLETEDGFEACVSEDQFSPEIIESIEQRYAEVAIFEYETVEERNWNEEWEKNYHPAIIEGKCIIRAAFHKTAIAYPYEIIITPKMAFGTGHHPTTYLMLKMQMEIDHSGKRVMDAGCGTAILSIMASKRGAVKVEAFDIDDWCIENARENIEKNNCFNTTVSKGTISELTFSDDCDILLANINKNVLINEFPQYLAYLISGGLLFLSGFFEDDIPELLTEASRYPVAHVKSDARDKWAMVLFRKL